MAAKKDDNWQDLATFCCGTCFYWVPKGMAAGKDLGRCRHDPPKVILGWPAVFADDWCGQHKLKTT